MKRFRMFLTGLSVLWILVLLCVFTYSWVARNFTSSLTQDNIQIASIGALVISLTGDDNFNTVSLNDVCNIDEFIFKQVSSQDGKHFYGVNFQPTITGGEPVFETTKAGEKYIDAKFFLKLDENSARKYVFLVNSLTDIWDDTEDNQAASAIRISLTFQDGDKETTYILGRPKNGENVDFSTEGAMVGAEGKTLYEPGSQTEFNSLAVRQQAVYPLDYFHGGRGYRTANPFDPNKTTENYNFTLDQSRCLFPLNPGETKEVKMRVWLEGCDPDCTNAIASKLFSLCVMFDAMEAP